MGKSPLQDARKWTAAVCALVGVHIVVSLMAPRSFFLTAFGDLTQCALLLCGTVAAFSNVISTQKKTRLFWTLMGVGLGLWLGAQTLWTYFEVLLRQETPNPFIGDVILFLHIVPMIAAVALQPHIEEDHRSARAGSLDFVLLLVWWLFLYLFIVIPWQYVYPQLPVYGRNFDLLYGSAQLVLVLALIPIWRRSSGAWRTLYGSLFGAALFYGIASMVASEAIDFHVYYTGSLFDVPLVAAMAWFAGIGMMAPKDMSASRTAGLEDIDDEGPVNDKPRAGTPTEAAQPAAATQDHGIWKARLAMLAVFFTPLMVAWAQFGEVPPPVRIYRLLLTVAVMILMGLLVFLKQHLLDQELLNLLRLSRQNLDEMCVLKDALENKEQSLRWHSLELQRKNLELQEISFTDALTGVWNRRYMEEILAAEASQVLRNYQRARGGDIRKVDHRDLVFIMVDVDFFKEVNDQHGHPAGDRLLQLVAERLSTVVRKSDVLVRWGGEEFLIMNRSTDPTGTPQFCSRILEVMAAEPFDLGYGLVVRKTCSVGWAPYPWCRSGFEAVCAEEVVALADTALYRAKALGRNQGVGLLPSDVALADPSAIKLLSLQSGNTALARAIRTECPTPGIVIPTHAMELGNKSHV